VRVLGIDPSVRSTGYGVIECAGSAVRLIEAGIISTNAFTLFGWDDTRNSDITSPSTAGFGGGLQDIYTAEVQGQRVQRFQYKGGLPAIQ